MCALDGMVQGRELGNSQENSAQASYSAAEAEAGRRVRMRTLDRVGQGERVGQFAGGQCTQKGCSTLQKKQKQVDAVRS